MDCGPTCLAIVAQSQGAFFRLEDLRDWAGINRQGVSLHGLSTAAERMGYTTLPVLLDLETLRQQAPLPAILHWRQRHFVVLYRLTHRHAWIADPAVGLRRLDMPTFLEGWLHGAEEAAALLLEPTPAFPSQSQQQRGTGFGFLVGYLRPYRRLFVQLFLGLLLGSLLQLSFPFLTQALVDTGVGLQQQGFIYVLLAAQLMLLLSRATVDFIRSWIVLFIGTRVNVRLVADFLAQLMRLPIAYFDTKHTGDLLQRTGDHYRIERFLTSTVLQMGLAALNLLTFGLVLAVYDSLIFAVFVIGTLLYLGWITLFLGRRRELDSRRFEAQRDNQDQLVQLFHGMQAIKLHNAEQHFRWGWERVQARLYHVQASVLRLDQWQKGGAILLHESQNVLITFLAAQAVLDGRLSLGMMLSVQYILGQLNGPIDQLIGFTNATQDARLSLQRLAEIHDQPAEEPDPEEKVQELPAMPDIRFEKVSFSYPGSLSPVLQDIDLHIPAGKVTAIVGASGSGKTTLLKLLLKFYAPDRGRIRVGPHALAQVAHAAWRRQVGTVLQEAYLFDATIEQNIALGESRIDPQRLQAALDIANLRDFLDQLPLGLKTKVGMQGVGLSQGQKQRLLIARAVYLQPALLLFDEATNALDAANERLVLGRLEEWCRGRTVVVVAHRLSTVRHADQIIVLEGGRIVEQGDHATLTAARGPYYQLVHNQLELGQ
jgi:ATP-binding cassette, subfamily B, bacterial